MANRAYLYVSNGQGEDNFRLIDTPPEAWYYDSRHNLPSVWLFFFAPDNLRLLPRGGYHEIRLVSPRLVGVERFHRREPLLRTLLAPLVGWEWAEGLVRDISQTEGRNLILDPNEVLSEDEEVFAPRLQAYLSGLDLPPPADPGVTEFWQRLYWESEDAREMRMLGTTYVRDGSDYGFPDGYPTDE